MPSHPDRVRRWYDDQPTLTIRRCTCSVITGGHRVPSTAACPVHPLLRESSSTATPLVITDEGFIVPGFDR